jgi:uncharacterized protein involved in exopolysaccharide biosynthesis
METAASSDRRGPRHWVKLILIPALLATLAGFLVSYAFPSRYTSTAEILVEAPKISDAIVPQVFAVDLQEQMNEVVGRATSEARLRSRVEMLGLAKGNRNVDDVIGSVQQNLTIQQAPDMSQTVDAKEKSVQGTSAAFYVIYTASTAREAQQICAALTSMLIEEDLRARQDRTTGTTAFLTQQVADAKQNLDDMDKNLASFKNQHVPSSLSVDYDNARRAYQDDLAKLSVAKMASQAANQAEGAQMALLNSASLPDSPDFPNRVFFAVGGLIAGLVFGIGLALLLRFRRTTFSVANSLPFAPNPESGD